MHQRGRSIGGGREAHGKENPRKLYAASLRARPALLVRGSSRRITIMRFRPANIRVINRRNSRLDRDSHCLLRKKKTKKYLTGHSISALYRMRVLGQEWTGSRCSAHVVEKTKSATQVAFACTLHLRVTWSAMKCAFADIRNRYTELMAARARDRTQTLKKLTPFGASAKHSKRKKLLTLASPN